MRGPQPPSPVAMTRQLRRLAALALAGLVLALPARATPFSTDFTDLWWVGLAEDGWGVNVVQQGDVLFLTFFVYGSDNAARWLVAPAMGATAAQPANGTRFSGDLYQTTGPWFGGPFNPAQVTANVVGSATVTFDTPASGTLSYTVNNTPVVKAIVRQTFRANSVAGFYYGGMLAIASQCGNSQNNGAVDVVGSMTATQTGAQASFQVDFFTSRGATTCLFAGTVVPQGRLASIPAGNWSCSIGGTVDNRGSFTMTGIDPQRNGFHAAITATDQYCNYSGRFGGTREAGT